MDIVICCRIGDSEAKAISLRDDLAAVFGDEQVFVHASTMQVGIRREQIERQLRRCKVALVLIGQRWLDITDEQIDTASQFTDDVHRQSIAIALAQPGLTVIPVLVDGARMPRPEQLPQDMRKLTEQQAREIVDTQGRRETDLAILVNDIRAARVSAGLAKSLDTPPTKSANIGWLRLDMTMLGIAFALTLLVAIYAYLKNEVMGAPDLFFVLLVFYAVSLVGRWMWARVRGVTRGNR